MSKFHLLNAASKKSAQLAAALLRDSKSRARQIRISWCILERNFVRIKNLICNEIFTCLCRPSCEFFNNLIKEPKNKIDDIGKDL